MGVRILKASCVSLMLNIAMIHACYADKVPLIETSAIEIVAPAADVYRVMLDFDNYGLWNPWLFEAEGEAVVGGQVWARLLLDGVEMQSDHIITTLTPSQVFCWRDAMWYSFMAGGERCRYLQQTATNRTLVSGTFQFRGWFAAIGHALYADQMQEGMTSELAGLKRYLEQ